MTVAQPRRIAEHDDLPRPERIAQSEQLLSELQVEGDGPRAEELRDRLVRINMVVAREVARRYEGRGIAAEDLHQVAYVGLVKAVRNFDSAKGGEFLSYAVPTIRGEVRRWFRDAGWVVRPPRSVQERQARVTRAQADLTHAVGRPPTPGEIARHLDEPERDVSAALAASGCFTPSSLDDPGVAGDEGTALAGRLGDAEPGYAQVEARVALRPLLRDLDERERTMLRMRFLQGATQAQIGQEMGVTQTQVSRLMAALLSRMRSELADAA